jgi:predicted nuclease of predicted toxin-antitoxin system
MKFLLDENISPQTANFLRRLNFDVKSILEEKLSQLEDYEIVKLAKKDKRVILTFDLDFGETYYFWEKGKICVIILRLKDQTIESVNKILGGFIKKHTLNPKSRKIDNKLIILEEDKERIIS